MLPSDDTLRRRPPRDDVVTALLRWNASFVQMCEDVRQSAQTKNNNSWGMDDDGNARAGEYNIVERKHKPKIMCEQQRNAKNKNAEDSNENEMLEPVA